MCTRRRGLAWSDPGGRSYVRVDLYIRGSGVWGVHSSCCLLPLCTCFGRGLQGQHSSLFINVEPCGWGSDGDGISYFWRSGVGQLFNAQGSPEVWYMLVLDERMCNPPVWGHDGDGRWGMARKWYLG